MATELTVAPFEAAVARLAGKTPIASRLTSAEWEEYAAGLREQAFFSAQVDEARTLSEMQSRLGEALDPTADPDRAFMDRSKFVAEMRELLGAPEGDSGDLADLTSRRRLELIHDFQTEDAIEGARWKAGQDPDLREAFPARELIRVESRNEERDWDSRWRAAGGRLYGGRMIAKTDDPVWTAISRFGQPWPPFDFGSGMGTQDIERDEAIALRVIEPDEIPAAQDESHEREMQASLPDASPEILAAFRDVFGDQVTIDANGKITWRRGP